MVGENIKRIRKFWTLTEVELASVLEIPVTILQKIEDGRRQPDLKLANQIAKTLKTNVIDLYNDEFVALKVSESLWGKLKH